MTVMWTRIMFPDGSKWWCKTANLTTALAAGAREITAWEMGEGTFPEWFPGVKPVSLMPWWVAGALVGLVALVVLGGRK